MSSPLLSKHNYRSEINEDPYSTVYVENLLGVFINNTGSKRMEKHSRNSTKHIQSIMRSCQNTRHRHSRTRKTNLNQGQQIRTKQRANP